MSLFLKWNYVVVANDNSQADQFEKHTQENSKMLVLAAMNDSAMHRVLNFGRCQFQELGMA
jgi:hypothetical protein